MDVFETPNTQIEHILLLPGIAVTFIAALASKWPLFFASSTLNAAIFAGLLVKRHDPFRFQLLVFSIACMIAGMPDFVLLHLDLHRSACFGLAFTGYIMLETILSRAPHAGFLGAIVSGAACAVFFRGNDNFINIGGQVAGAFLLVHSLRWEDHNLDGRTVRKLGSFIWILHSLYWVFDSAPDTLAFWTTSCLGAAVIVVYFAARLIFGAWGTRMVPYTALLVVLSGATQRLFFILRQMPIGLIVLAASFALFGVGTALALTRHRWHKPEMAKS